jgi:diguanylate cyclase (GGDEF)-like protein/PAS domain S-box-containing protein
VTKNNASFIDGPDENLVRALRLARCILWHASIERTKEGEWQWNGAVLDLESAQSILPLHASETHSYFHEIGGSVLSDDLPTVRHANRQAMSTNQANYHLEFRVRDVLGNIHILSDDVSLNRKSATIWEASGVIRDVTEERQMQHALLQTLEGARCILWESVVEYREGDYHWDMQAHFPRAIQAFLGATMASNNELGNLWRQFIPARDRLKIYKHTVEALKNGVPSTSVEFRLRGQSGELRWMREEITIEPLTQGSGRNTQWRLVGVCIDQTEQHEAIHSMHASWEAYRTLFENAPLGIYRTSARGEGLLANPACLSMLGFESLEEFQQSNLEGECHEAGYDRQRFRDELLKSGSVLGWEGRWRRRDGGVIFLRENARVVRSGLGELLYFEGTLEDITERRQAQQRIIWQATHDELTSLPNRRLFQERLALALDTARQKEGYLVSVLFVDLDRFKQINDTLGHDAGDRVLKTVAHRLINIVRPGDTVARLGGDEFLILLPGITSLNVTKKILAGVRKALHEPMVLHGQMVVVSGSVGVANFPKDGEDSNALLRNADIAMYQAKKQGGDGSVSFRSAMQEEVWERSVLESDLRLALERDELCLYYQPQQSLRDYRIQGVEALVRWKHPTRGLVLPGHFIGIAEESGLIVALGERVMREVFKQANRWNEQKTPISIAINISGRQLSDRRFATRVAALIAETKTDAKLLRFEITETALLECGDDAFDTLADIKAMGIRLEMDDFGTGFSSLSMLRRCPVDVIKIDRSFVQGMTQQWEDAVIVRSVIDMAQALGMTVIAEGIETREQWEQLQHLGCDAVQGYLLGRPVPAGELAAVIRRIEKQFTEDENTNELPLAA